MQTALALVAHLLDLDLRQHFETAFGPDLGIDRATGGRLCHALGGSFAVRHYRYRGGSRSHGSPAFDQGRISIGTLFGVISQMSIMSEFDTAMQPLVQSTVL